MVSHLIKLLHSELCKSIHTKCNTEPKCTQEKFCRKCSEKVYERLKSKWVKDHKPNGKNFAETKLYDFWELGKAFIPAPGYEQIKTPRDTDAPGLLYIMLRAQIFRQEGFTCVIKKPPKVSNWVRMHKSVLS